MLAILAGVTALFVILAVVTLIQRAREMAPKFDPQAAFAELADKADALGEIAIIDKSGGFHVRLVDGKWVLPERGSFPADISVVRATAVGMANLQIIEPKTANSEWLHFLGLSAPEDGGEARRVTFYDKSGTPLADLLIGNSVGGTDSEGRRSFYMRRGEETQAWLARGYLSPPDTLGAWLDKSIISITRNRVKSVSVTPPEGAAYVISRDDAQQNDFALEDMPPGRALSYPGAATSVAIAIADFSFDDVRPAADVNFLGAADYVLQTFNGLTLRVQSVERNARYWTLLSASATTEEAKVEADAINARAQGWAFALPDYRAATYRSSRDSLLNPPDND